MECPIEHPIECQIAHTFDCSPSLLITHLPTFSPHPFSQSFPPLLLCSLTPFSHTHRYTQVHIHWVSDWASTGMPDWASNWMPNCSHIWLLTTHHFSWLHTCPFFLPPPHPSSVTSLLSWPLSHTPTGISIHSGNFNQAKQVCEQVWEYASKIMQANRNRMCVIWHIARYLCSKCTKI